MNLKRFFAAVVLVAAGAFGSAHSQTFCPTPGSVSVPYASGSISISYQICFPSQTNFSSFYWDSTMTYSNVSFDGSFRINGSMKMRLDFANNAISSVAFNGGPLTYTISGQPYTVQFNNLTYSLNNAFQVGAPTGSLTINGVLYPADTAYFAYLFR
jgi:hypothetical protein